MAREIERKFLVRHDGWRTSVSRRSEMIQGYIAGNERLSARVRIAGKDAWLNLKSGGLVASRLEFEYAIPVDDARELLATCERPLIEKTRHFVPVGAFEWEIDEFHGANEGLIVAELELTDENQPFPHPEWLGAEVTSHARYYNVCLVERPYSSWTPAERNP